MFDIVRFLETSPIKLVKGSGNPETGGCWMAALSVYSGLSWSDHPQCVCPIIRKLCIAINDAISSDEARGRIIGPYLLLPVGTATDDQDVLNERRWHLIDAAVRRFAPHALRSAGLEKEAVKLEALPKVTAGNAARAAAYAAARAADAAYDAARAADAAYDAAYAAYDAAYDAAAYAAYEAAYDAAAVVDAAADEFIATVVMPVVLELCSIGSRVPIESSCDELAFRRAVQCV